MSASETEICHDLKSERTDVGQPLPQVMRLLPIAFFATVVGAALLSTVFLLRYRGAETAKTEWLAKETEYAQQLKGSEQKVTDIKLETVKAQEAASWIEGTRSMQEVVLAVTRSIDTNTTIGNLSINRQTDDPAKLQFAVKIDGSQAAEQLDIVLDRLTEIGYNAYAQSQSQGKKSNSRNYQATLIRPDSR